MLLDEDPATVTLIIFFQRQKHTNTGLQLIHHTIGNFNIHPDKTAISRINESLSTLQQARDLRLREAETALKSIALMSSSLTFVFKLKLMEP